jgi:hypothetical protein
MPGGMSIRRCHDLRDGEVEIDVGLEKDLLDGEPIHALRFDILDTVDVRADRVLAIGGDALLHFRCAQAGIAPDHRHHRDSDLGKNIRRRRAHRDDAEKQNQGGEHVECVRKFQREPDDAHDLTKVLSKERRAAYTLFPFPIARSRASLGRSLAVQSLNPM